MKAHAKTSDLVLILVVFTMLFGLSSCFDSNYDFNNISDEVELSPGIAVPLAHGRLTLEDIINEIDTTDEISSYDDGLLYITYAADLFSFKASDVIDIPDQDFLQFFIGSNIAVTTVLPVGLGETITFYKEKKGEFTFTHGEKIDSLNLRSSRLVIDVNSTFHHSGKLVIHTNNILVDGQPFSLEIPISITTGNFTFSFDEVQNNVKLILDNVTNPDTTYLPILFDLSLVNSGATVEPGEKCNITISLRQNNFASVFGFMGNYDIPVSSGQLDVSLFNETIEGGKLSFQNPRLALTVSNSYGVPIQVDLSDIEVTSDINNSTTPITFTGGVNPFNINAPLITQVGDYALDTIPLNRDNSNIVAAMETSPNHLNYAITAKTNVLGPIVHDNFVTDSSKMDLGLQVVLPLYVKAEGFAFEDTVDFDFESQFGTDLDMITYFRLTMDTDNGIPIQTKLQVYFLDAGKVVLDSMFSDNEVFLNPAETVGDKVSAPVNTINQVEFTNADLEKIKLSKFARVKASVNTPDDGKTAVSFYSYYGIDFKLSAKAGFLINSKNL